MTAEIRQHLAGAVVVSVLAMVSIAGASLFFVYHLVGGFVTQAEVNEDGIACLIEELNAHRQNAFAADKQLSKSHDEELAVPQPPAQPVPRELLKACERFLEAS